MGIKRLKLVTTWSDREIGAREEWKIAIDLHFQKAHIFICLVSPDFSASDCCYEREMQQALERQRNGTAPVIPLLVRPTDWELTPLSELQMLPSDAIAVSCWDQPDAAWVDIVKGIVPVIQELALSHRMKVVWLEEASTADERANQIEAADGAALQVKSSVLSALGWYQEALGAVERAIQINPADGAAPLLKS
jgi:hypothetical protein